MVIHASHKQLRPETAIATTCLPSWKQQFQAVNLGGSTRQEAMADIGRVVETIRAEKAKGLMILGLVIAGLMIFGR